MDSHGVAGLQGLSAPPLANECQLVVAHDESGDVTTQAFFACGLVFVPQPRIRPVVELLAEPRRAADYWGEVHFGELRNRPGTRYGGKTAVAMGWIEMVPQLVAAGLRAYVLVVNRRAPGFNGYRLPTPRYLAYNRYTRMAMESALPWLYKGEDLELRVISDDKHRTMPGGDDEFGAGDNFAEYLPWAVQRRADNASQSWPNVRFDPPSVELVDTSASLGSWESELLQLTDVLASASRAAISGVCSNKPAKRCVAEAAARLVREVAQPPWQQNLGLHRRVGFAEFQGDGFADPVPVRPAPPNQLVLPVGNPH